MFVFTNKIFFETVAVFNILTNSELSCLIPFKKKKIHVLCFKKICV